MARLLQKWPTMTGTLDDFWTMVGGQRRAGARDLAGMVSLSVLLCAASAVVGCGGATEKPGCVDAEEGASCPPVQQCLWNGTTYAEGGSVPAGDGCNTCTCAGGDWSCTAMGCEGGACVYEGQIRPYGSSFPARDGCNQCSCDHGVVACTERACEPLGCNHNGQLLANGAAVPGSDGCNSCTCIDGQVACTLIDCGNDCYSNGDCGESQYCSVPVGTCIGFGPTSGAADAETEELRAPGGQAPQPPGQCRDRPALCTEEPRQVCGCDGQTYRSPCAAASLGLNLASYGACPQSE